MTASTIRATVLAARDAALAVILSGGTVAEAVRVARQIAPPLPVPLFPRPSEPVAAVALPEVAPPARKASAAPVEAPASGKYTLDEYDGVRRYREARTAGDRRRPVHLVSTQGLLDELARMQCQMADAAPRVAFRYPESDMTPAQHVEVVTPDKRGGPSHQAKARRLLELYGHVIAEIDEELKARGFTDEQINDALLEYEPADAPKASLADFDFGGDE